MSDTTQGVKAYVEISLAVMRRRLESQYRVWLLCRHIDTLGRGCVTISQLRRFVKHNVLFSLRHLDRALAEPSVFYDIADGYVDLVSLLKVADALGVDLRDRPTWLPLDAFYCMFRLRQAFVAAIFAHKPRTIAIATLCELTGRTRCTVGRYLRSSHIVKIPNVMISDRDPNTVLTPEEHQEGWFHTRRAGKTVLAKRLPNTYETDLEPAAFGTVKHQRRSPSLIPAGELRRRYFSHPKGARRALQALSPHETVYLLSGNCFDDHGNQIWRGFWCLHPDSFHRPL